MKNKLLAYYTQYTWPSSRFIQHLKNLAQMKALKSMTEFLSDKTKNGQKRDLYTICGSFF